MFAWLFELWWNRKHQFLKIGVAPASGGYDLPVPTRDLDTGDQTPHVHLHHHELARTADAPTAE